MLSKVGHEHVEAEIDGELIDHQQLHAALERAHLTEGALHSRPSPSEAASASCGTLTGSITVVHRVQRVTSFSSGRPTTSGSTAGGPSSRPWASQIVVVVHRPQIPLGTVGEDRRDPGVRGHRARDPAGDQSDSPDAPPAGGVVGGGQLPTGPDCLGRGDPMHFGEVLVGDVARIDARSEATHQPGAGRLTEDGRADGVHSDQFQVGIELAQHSRDTRGVPARPDAAHQYVDVAQLRGQLQRERGVGRDVVGIVVLVRAPGVEVLFL
ncbi:hypothetical protein SMICM304S_12007 [Streptomyces microflavus]